MKKIILVIVVIIIAGAAVFYFLPKADQEPSDTATETGDSAINATAWVEVISPTVSAVAETKTELKSGDEVKSGATIETDKTGLAVIHFPDGSLARIDSETTLTLDETRYDPTDRTLRVKISLALGRVWSKIV